MFIVRWVLAMMMAIALSAAVAQTWETHPLSGLNGILLNVAWGGGQWVGVGTNGMVLTSPDGIQWTSRQRVNTNHLFGIVWNGSRWVAVGNAGTVLTSVNGIDWSNIGTGIGVGENLLRVSWSAPLQKFAAVSSSSGTVYTSSNGLSWSGFDTFNSSNNNITGYISDIAWGRDVFVAPFNWTSASPAQGVILRVSTVGIPPWEARRIYASNFLYGAAWNGSRFMLVGASGKVFVSTDGAAWSTNVNIPTGTVPGAGPLYGVAGAGSEWIAVGVDSLGSAGKIFSSTSNGVAWTQEESLPSQGLSRVVWGNGQFLAIGDNNKTYIRKSDQIFASGLE